MTEAIGWAKKFEGQLEKKKKQPDKRILWEETRDSFKRNEHQIGGTSSMNTTKGKGGEKRMPSVENRG